MRQQITAKNCQIVAVDNSESMVNRFQQNLQANVGVPVEVRCGDIRDVEIKDASVVVLNFTLQFIPVADKGHLLASIYQDLLPGGILLSEKLAFDDVRQQALQTDMHLFLIGCRATVRWKSQKRAAVETVLIPETFSIHQKRLMAAGFSSAEVWFQYFNFASIKALK